MYNGLLTLNNVKFTQHATVITLLLLNRTVHIHENLSKPDPITQYPSNKP